MLTVACVLKSGGVYDASWVQKLASGVTANLSREHRILCLSDLDVPGVPTIGLRHSWRRWWSKIELFEPGVFDGPVLYLDLDCIVTGSLDPLCEMSGFVMCKDFFRPATHNSSVMYWDRDMSNLYHMFKVSAGAQMDTYDRRRPQGRIGDQAFIEDHANVTIGTFPPGYVQSYKAHCRDGPGVSSVVAFHGNPKPNKTTGWSRRMWDAL